MRWFGGGSAVNQRSNREKRKHHQSEQSPPRDTAKAVNTMKVAKRCLG
jgi:hypothetical protein